MDFYGIYLLEENELLRTLW